MILLAAGLLAWAFAAPPPGAGSFAPYDSRAKAILAKMSLDEKIGQMTQADSASLKDPSDIGTYALGSVLSGGNSDPPEGNSLKNWSDLYERLQARTRNTRLRIPLLYGVDAVHGHNNVLGAVVFPHNIGLGCTRNPNLVEKAARVTAEEVRATGIQWAFAPCVTVPQDERWGRTYEGFSEDPQIVAQLGEAAVRGLQGSSLANPTAVVACAKHFIADGGTAWGTKHGGPGPGPGLDQGDAQVDEATLRLIHLPGYVSTLRAGVATIMPSYNSWNGQKVSGNKHLLTEVLKNELGFDGFLISDYDAIDQVNPDYKKAVEQSVNAGMDMAMAPDTYKKFFLTLRELALEGRVPMSRIDDAVTRILRVKIAAGLLDANYQGKADTTLQAKFGSKEHRQIARQAVRESLVLLKNDGKILPLAKTAARIHVGGKSADDIANQCGGWTVDWQGLNGGKGGVLFPGGVTVLSAIRQTASSSTQITYAKDGTGGEGATVGVVVIGERPYAEGFGDRADLALDAADVAAVKNMKSARIPVVVIVMSGRPVILGDVLDKADAVIAAWLPGTEGAGITDVLFGDFAPTGKLSFSWPRSMDQVPLRTRSGAPLFPLGYGLSY